MSDRSKFVPSYRQHKQSGQAIVTLTSASGRRRDVLLGKWGSAASRAEYARVIAEWEAAGRRLAETTATPTDLAVNELLLAFWTFAQEHYRHPDGTPTSELNDFRLSLRPVRELYGMTPAARFGPLALRAVREQMIEAGLCRNVINARIRRIVRVFKWAASMELVAPSVHHGLATVVGLKRGRSAARETEPVKPVPEAFVRAVLPHVMPPVAAMIELQLFTGMRPGEVCVMRGCDLDTSGEIWTYRPGRHKTAWRGRDRIVCLGPAAQAIVRPFLTLETESHLFSPGRAMTDRAATMRAIRKTPVQPSQQNRRVGRRRKKWGDCYQRGSYSHAVTKGCDRADRWARQQAENAAAEAEGRPAVKVAAKVVETQRLVPRWFPNQLRHNHATEVRKRFGLEAAGAALGHAKMSATEVYAEKDQALALRVAREIG
jgi:integrase